VEDVAEAATISEEKTEAVVIETEVACTKASDAEETSEAPEKRLTRISRAWEMEGGDAQLQVKEGDFVNVWLSSGTEHGWIYAEDPVHSEKAGWLPDCVLEELTSNQQWKRATQDMEAAHETQLGVVEGTVYKVSMDTRTKEGWIYTEACGVTTDGAEDGAVQAGWVPVFCFGETADLQE